MYELLLLGSEGAEEEVAMAYDSPYVTPHEYLRYVGKTDEGDNDLILLGLNTISRYIEGRTGRVFNTDTSDQTWYVEVYESGATLRIPDGLSAAPASITVRDDYTQDWVDLTALGATEYTLLPANALLHGEPYTHIQRLGASFTKGQTVRIVGKRGWPGGVPAGIKIATLELAALLRIETPRATIRIPEGGIGEAIEMSRDAQNIIWKVIDSYRAWVGFA